MKQIIIRLIIFSISALSFYACSSLGKIAIQVAIPPEEPIPQAIQSIAILNRSMTPDFINLKTDSVEKITAMSQTFLDSSAVDTTIKVAARAIFDSQRFDVVVPLARSFVRDDYGSILSPLDSASIDEICKEFKVDAVLVLEYFTEKVDRSIVSRYWGVNLSYILVWRFYQPKQKPPVLSFLCKDEIFWNDNLIVSEKLTLNLPTIKEALIGGALASGSDMANLICPKWVDETRFYCITGNKEIDAAIPLIKMDNWDEAEAIWIKYSSEPDKSLRRKVEYNLALASEMKGNIDLAVEWGNKSLKTKYSRNAADYIMNLSRRSLNHNRYYYATGNPVVDTAISMMKQHKWDEAAEIWMKYYSINDKILKSKIEYNLALTEEMKGNIDLAIKWCAKSLKTNNSLNTKQYLSELQRQSPHNIVVNNSNFRISAGSWSTEPSMIPWTLNGRED